MNNRPAIDGVLVPRALLAQALSWLQRESDRSDQDVECVAPLRALLAEPAESPACAKSQGEPSAQASSFTDDFLNAAYWDFDARRKGYAPYAAPYGQECRAFKAAVISALTSDVTLHPGEPTQEMLNAIRDRHFEIRGCQLCAEDYLDIWRTIVEVSELKRAVAAHPQGAPVAIYQAEFLGEGGGGWSDVEHAEYLSLRSSPEFRLRTVYAEQPAPGAVVLPERWVSNGSWGRSDDSEAKG